MKAASTTLLAGELAVEPEPASKSKRRLRIVLLAAFVFLWSGLSYPQSRQEPPSSSPATVLITARTKSGATPELSPADLEIKEDGKQATIHEVRRLGGTPLHYCVLFDTSGSEREKFQLQQGAAAELLKEVVQPGRDRGWLVLFNDRVYLGQESQDPQAVMKAIARAWSHGGTALYDAMVTCADRMWKSAPGLGLHTVFIFSDGQDNASHTNRDSTVSALLRSGLRVYAVGQQTKEPNSKGPRVLKQFAERTGGKVYFPSKEEDVNKSVADIANDLASSLLVTYSPPEEKPDEKLHKLEVKCSKKDLLIKAPDRHYTPKP